ncbi:MAG: transglutaminase domain-containing protein, partial [Clostridia bacterium]|nr:transglutaminase domain-containing protein [Clostridia bacterium]
FGNLDPHRYVCCTDFQRQLDPAKTCMRLDPDDNQSGEIEYSDECLSYSDVNCSKKLLEAEQLP